MMPRRLICAKKCESDEVMPNIVIPNEIFFENLLDELEDSGHVLLKVKGWSMFPFFRNEKDSVLLRSYVPAEGLKNGDVVLFRFHGRFILHRCIGKRVSVYIFRGDGNCKGTEWARPEDVVAVVEKRISPSGREWSCGSFSWKLCSRLWPRTYIVRRLLLGILRRIYK